MESNSFPYFFVIGAQKAGTSTLQEWLKEHPKLSLPIEKETAFFNNDRTYAQGLDSYLKLFPSLQEGQIRGEINPEYLTNTKAPERILKFKNNIKIIVIFRNPLERAYSHYQMSKARGIETLTFIDAVNSGAERGRDSSNEETKGHLDYINRSLYSKHLEHWLKYYDKESFLFLNFENLFSVDSDDSLGRLFKFLSISSLKIEDKTKKHNAAWSPRFPLLSVLMSRGSKFRKFLAFFIRNSDVRLFLAKAWGVINYGERKKEKDNVDFTLISKNILIELLDDLERLELITSLNLSSWKQNLKLLIGHAK